MTDIGFGDRLRIAWRVMTGGYEAGRRSRRNLDSWRPRGGDADADSLLDLPELRSRSRDAIRNLPIAGGAIATKVTNVVGTGLRLNAQIDRDYLGLSEDRAESWEKDAERLFNQWAGSAECDAERTLTFAAQQELAFRAVLESGDVFALLPAIARPGALLDLRVQLIEADRVSNPRWKSDTPTLTGGVEKDRAGAPVAYHITRTHPGRLYNIASEWDRYPAFGARTGRRNVLHLYHKRRVGQTRGIPDLAPVIEELKQLGRYTQAEIDAAVVTAFLAIITKSEGRAGFGGVSPTGAPARDDKSEPYRLGPATVLDLQDGEEVTTVQSSRPNSAFDPFVLAVLRQVGACLEIPFELLVKHFTSSYSAARAALEDAKRFFRGRRVWLACNFCQPVYEAFLHEAVARDLLRAPGFLTDARVRAAYLGDYRDQWIGPAWAQIDPVKEYNAAALAEDRGWKTATENTAEFTGGDWGRKQDRRRREQTVRAEMPQPAMPTAADTLPEPSDDHESTTGHRPRAVGDTARRA